MKILYCNVREMDEYNGYVIDGYHGGGSYTENKVPLEVNNFTRHGNLYYGYVQSTHDTINIQKNFGASPNSDSIDNVLVVWVCHQSKIVGFYIDATVYRNKQPIPNNIAAQRSKCEGAGYNIITKQAILIPSDKRKIAVTGMGRCNIWYGNDDMDQKVLKYLQDYQKSLNDYICSVEANSDIKGEEYECLVKQRVNQGVFREQILERFHCKCALCSVSNASFLIASHIKPWSKSDPNEKLSIFNGLLLCPNHDKLFDKGYISFSDNGQIMISNQLSDTDKLFLNVNDKMRIPDEFICEEMKVYLHYHRQYFKG
ncbi:HNH endonuclease [Ruminococcus albus]|uniref:HNH endonuclease n=1 Tax=Ruminococcus albus TaxID=1264 RepID=A0A1H7NF77_RUMAL|nr:HNH endonuclease [Ruminococcus albus]SEL22094.1 HNH endonuclease [Ruminococcus albus]